MRSHVFDTDKKYLSVYSPYDLIWGVGCRTAGPPAQQLLMWHGSYTLDKHYHRV